MSKGARRKRAPRPWQNPDILGDLSRLAVPASDDDELALEGYRVQRVDAGRAVKEYTCPECGNPVPVGEPHLVVWPESDSDLRRHWHRHCWRLEVRRSR